MGTGWQGWRCSRHSCQLLSSTEHLNGWEIFGAIKNTLWGFAPGIIQADGVLREGPGSIFRWSLATVSRERHSSEARFLPEQNRYESNARNAED